MTRSAQSCCDGASDMGASLDQVLIEEAAAWMARLWADDVSDEDRAGCQRWRVENPRHEQAWQQLCEVSGTFSRLPASSNGTRVLENARQTALSRRHFLQWTSAVMVTSIATAYGLNRSGGWRGALAQYQTGVGETTRKIILEDDTQLVLNTDTAVDVVFTPQQRRIVFYHGELLIETGKEGPHRDFVVDTDYGRLTALGTTFTVRQYPQHAEVVVLDGAVRVEAGHTRQTLRLEAGQRTSVNGNSIASPQKADPSSSRWQDGLLVVERMRVNDFMAEIARYRRGFVFCDEAVAGLEVTGVFSTQDTDRALHSLASSLPVDILYRTPYWVKAVPK